MNLAEIADWPGTSTLLCAPQRDLYRLPVLSIRSDGNKKGRPPRKNNDNGRTPKGHENKTPKVSDGESSGSSNQEEIIALFKRIQTSISKGESISSKKRSSDSSKGKKSAEAVLDVLRLSGKQVKDSTANKSKSEKALFGQRDMLKKEEKAEAKENEPILEFQLTRPPSNFVKRSPIPLPSTPREKVNELNSENSSRPDSVEELPRFEEMKLPELKELAKSRGIKGYSRLKKSELVELLRGH